MDVSPAPHDDVVVHQAPQRKEVAERALVLQALGIPHRIQGHPGGFLLAVPLTHAGPARLELQRWTQENVGWPPRYDTPELLSTGKVGAALYIIGLIAWFPAGLYGFMGHNIWRIGRVDAARIRAGELWRTVTALTLHADLSHLVGNLVFGTVFAVLASHSLGSGLAWLCFVGSGALGNLINAWLQDPSHTAIGASTGVFGILGALSAYEWTRRHSLRFPPMRRWAPMAAGATLLGYLGMGREGGNTDVMAHVWGLVAGALLGVVLGRTQAPAATTRAGRQTLCGVAALVIVFVCWAIAWGS